MFILNLGLAGVECLQAEGNADWVEQDGQAAECVMLERFIPTEHWTQEEQHSYRLRI